MYLFSFSIVLLFIIFTKMGLFVGVSSLHHRKHRRYHPKELTVKPLVSVLVPAYNEGPTLNNCINSLLVQDYPNYEIIIINDGSTDDTLSIARKIKSKHSKLIRVIDKPNGGKASALNAGTAKAKGEIVVSIDADSIFLKNSLRELVLSFQDPAVGAVGGNVRVANRRNFFGMHQAIEYITGLTIQRCAFAYIGCMQVISGAIGAFRKDCLLEIGGYSNDTIVEDMDVTVALVRNGHKVVYNRHAIAYTEAPENIFDFAKQRYRWVFGGFQVAAKHHDILFKRHLNRMGTIGMPYFIFFPWIEVLAVVLLLYRCIEQAIRGDVVGLVIAYFLLASVQAFWMLYALIIDKENKWLMFLGFIYSLFYSYVITFITIKAGINYLRRKRVTWNKLQRYGKNAIP